MKFCDKCGSRMREEKTGFTCPKCGNVADANGGIRKKKVEQSGSVYVVDSKQNEYVKVRQACPRCGNNEAFHWYSGISGEHAGIRREITTEHFRCTKCSHSWTRSS
jgi:DNA-directed RNA polymerase subunit M/transcription elongation factor TFIIS